MEGWNKVVEWNGMKWNNHQSEHSLDELGLVVK